MLEQEKERAIRSCGGQASELIRMPVFGFVSCDRLVHSPENYTLYIFIKYSAFFPMHVLIKNTLEIKLRLKESSK